MIKDERLTKYNKALIIAMIFFIIVVAQGIFGEKGFFALINAEKERDALEAEINKLTEENDKLRDEIEKLKNDKCTIEKEARERFYYSWDGEKVILVQEEE